MNQRPSAPKADALPDCATLRNVCLRPATISIVADLLTMAIYFEKIKCKTAVCGAMPEQGASICRQTGGNGFVVLTFSALKLYCASERLKGYQMKIRKLVGIDLLPSERRAKEMGFPYFPVHEFIAFCAGTDVDIIEVLCTLQLRVPEDGTVEAAAQARQQFEKKRYALEMCGVRVIECPSKRSQNSPSGFKQSDDQRLMIRTLTLAMKLRPDFVTLVASDGDYTPMVEALRDEGIRTEVVASLPLLANDLRRHVVKVIDLDAVLEDLCAQQRANGTCRQFGCST